VRAVGGEEGTGGDPAPRISGRSPWRPCPSTSQPGTTSADLSLRSYGQRGAERVAASRMGASGTSWTVISIP